MVCVAYTHRENGTWREDKLRFNSYFDNTLSS